MPVLSNEWQLVLVLLGVLIAWGAVETFRGDSWCPLRPARVS